MTGAFNLGTGRGHSVRRKLSRPVDGWSPVERISRLKRRHAGRGIPQILVAASDKAARELGLGTEAFADLGEIVRIGLASGTKRTPGRLRRLIVTGR